MKLALLVLIFGIGLIAHALPTLQICSNAEMTSQAVGDGIQYSCAAKCTSGTCALCDSNNSCRVSFVVDGMGGHLYYNQVSTLKGTVVFHPPLGMELDDRNVAPLRASGLQVVEINWEKGVTVKTDSASLELAWFSRKDSAPSHLKALSERPAAVMQWIYENMAKKQKIGTAGCSGGALATFLPVFYHGLDSLVSYQWLGGIPYFDIGWMCGAGPRAYEFNDLIHTKFPVRAQQDYVHVTKSICQDHDDSPAFSMSSPREGGGNWKVTHPIDFSNTVRAASSDEMMGVRAHTLSYYQNVQSSQKTLTTIVGAHCGPEEAVAACQQTCQAMLGKSDCGCGAITTPW